MAKKKVARIVVTVDNQHLSTIDAVAKALRSAGMRITNVLNTTGIITGEIAKTEIAALRAVSGVASVEPDEEMRAI